MVPSITAFLEELFLKIRESDAEPTIIYPFLKRHLVQLTDDLPTFLDNWASSTLSVLTCEQQERLAKDINNFSMLLRSFPFGNQSINYEIVIAGYHTAEKVFSKLNFPEDWASLQNNLAVAYCNRAAGDRAENIEHAIELLNAALEIRTQTTLPEQWANTQNNLGIAYGLRILGSPQQNLKVAAACHKRALKIQNLSTDPDGWATSHFNLGKIYSEWVGKFRMSYQERAIWHYQKALQVFTRANELTQWADLQDNLGTLYQERKQGNPTQNIRRAIAYHQQALEALNAEADPLRWAITQSNLGAAYFRYFRDFGGGSINQAITAYQASLQTYRAQNLLYDYALTSYNLGLTYRLAKQFRAAHDTFADALETVETLRHRITLGTEVKQKLAEEWNLLYQGMVETCLALGDSAKALEYVERSKARNLSELLADRQADNRLTPLQFAQMQALLPNDQAAIIEWYVTPEKLIAFIVSSRGNPVVWQPSETEVMATLQSLIDWFNQYIEVYEYDRSQWQQNLDGLLSDLSQILAIDAVLALLPAYCNQLIWIPHGFLHLLPLHALSLEADGSFLCDLFPGGIRYAPSCQLLYLIQSEFYANPAHLVAVQNPVTDLALSNLEVENIQRHFKAAVVLKENQANRERLLQALHSQESAFALHLSTHGYFNDHDPYQSPLILAHSAAQPFSTSEHHLQLPSGQEIDLEQCLTLADLFDMVLPHCRLVVQSACETGRIDFQNVSDEYIGLSSGWLYAGSPSVVSSLWAVDDLSTAFLMMKFYELLQARSSVAISLQDAQRWLRELSGSQLRQWLSDRKVSLSPTLRLRWLNRIQDEDRPFQSSYYWAAFCAIGR